MADPVSFDILNPVNFTVPGLFYATSLAGRCVVDGLTSEAFYAAWHCPRIIQTVQVAIVDNYLIQPLFKRSNTGISILMFLQQGYGHCDFLNPIPWQGG